MGLDGRRTMVEAMRKAMLKEGRKLAYMAREETGLGRADDKTIKNRLVTIGTPGPEDLEPNVVTGDDGMMITEWAPYGVIGSISPTTNPTSTIINNSIAMISAGNAVVFNVHPSAKRVSVENIKLLNRAIVEAGGPSRPDHRHPQSDAGKRPGGHVPPGRQGLARHRRSRSRQRSAEDPEEGDHGRPGEPACGSRPDRRHLKGRSRHRQRGFLRQQHHLCRREDHDRCRHGRRPAGPGDDSKWCLPAQGARAEAAGAGDLQGDG